jgi:hypothetical protein
MDTMDFPQLYLPLQGMIRSDLTKRNFNPKTHLNKTKIKLKIHDQSKNYYGHS